MAGPPNGGWPFFVLVARLTSGVSPRISQAMFARSTIKTSII